MLLHVTGSATVFTPTQQGIFGDGAVAKVLSDIGNASTAASSGFPSFDVTFHGNVGVGQIVHVEVDAFFLSGGDGFSGTAQADPLPAIDPAFPNASLYSIVLSDGLLTQDGQPGTGIGEPGGLPLFILTLAGLIFMARGYRYGEGRNKTHLS